MIAPTNCNPDCDCAQRMVRCQKASAKSPAELDFVEKHIASPVEPNLKWEDYLEKEAKERADLVRQAQDSLTRRNVFLDRLQNFVGKLPTQEVRNEMAQEVMTFLEPPPYVIPASLGVDPERPYRTFIDALDKLEKEFPATMGIAPFPEDSPGVTLREFTPEENAAFDATAKYPGVIEQRAVVYEKSNLRASLIKAFRACELDCGMWSDNALRELADIAIATLEKK